MEKYLIIIIIVSLIESDYSEEESMIFKKFQKFIKKFNKNYNSINEFFARYQVFKNNILSIKTQNLSFKTGITQFADLTQQEFKKKYLNLNYDAIAVSNFSPYYPKKSNDAPSSFDWRTQNRVTSVKGQSECNSAWAYSAMGNLEGLYAGYYGILEDFSISLLVDCDNMDSGCYGGIMEYAFTWLKSNGIMTEEDYHTTGYKSSCKSNRDKYVNMTVTGFKKLGRTGDVFSCVDEESMKEFLYENGPLSIAFNAYCLHLYSRGIVDMDSEKCPISGINHAALLVGYGTDSTSGLDYWIVKNQWGDYWGENGYFRIRRGNGTCGINCYVISATVSF